MTVPYFVNLFICYCECGLFWFWGSLTFGKTSPPGIHIFLNVYILLLLLLLVVVVVCVVGVLMCRLVCAMADCGGYRETFRSQFFFYLSETLTFFLLLLCCVLQSSWAINFQSCLLPPILPKDCGILDMDSASGFFMWLSGMELRSSGLLSNCFYLLGPLAVPGFKGSVLSRALLEGVGSFRRYSLGGF